MSYNDFTDGVLGLEGIHTWLGTFDTVVMNDKEAGLPRTKVTQITGLHSLPEAEDPRANRYGRIGEVAYPGMARGKTVTYEGVIQALTLQGLRQEEQSMRRAFGDRVNECWMEVRPHPTYGDGIVGFKGRVLSLDIDDVQSYGPTRNPTAFQRKFTLSLRQADPRYVRLPEVSGGGAVTATNLIVPNYGSAPADPVFRIHGPLAAADLLIERRSGAWKQLLVEDITIAGGEELYVDFRQRWVIRDDGLDLAGHLNFTESDWWDAGVPGLEPGDNTIRVTTAPNGYDVVYWHSSW